MASNNFIDINKGFRRLGNFPMFADEIFDNYADAAKYATLGPYGGSAYVGQLIRVVPKSDLDEPKIYIINNEYKLVSTENAIIANDNLSVTFDYNSFSGTSAVSIILPQGFVLNTITVKIIQGFANDDAIRVAKYKYDDPSTSEYLIASGSGKHLEDIEAFYNPQFTMITDEDDSEFVFKFTESLQIRTLIVIYLDRTVDVEERGKGILKIN